MMRQLRLNDIRFCLVFALLIGAFGVTAPAAAQGVEGACGDVGSVSHVTVRRGDASPDVEHAQCLLNDNWGYSLDMDGQFGELTQTAVEEVQSINGLAIDGEIGPCTWAVLHVVDPPAGC
jgi:murein L,D-transpeptidase YcbB/YkuD